MATLNKPKRKQSTCYCCAYKFPHRLDSGNCRDSYNANSEVSYADQRIAMSVDFYESGHSYKDFA
jgi:hypothetical protein